MSKKAKITIGSLLLLVVCISLHKALFPAQKEYQGKTFEVWVNMFIEGGPKSPAGTNFAEVIRSFGPEVVPKLLRLVRVHDSHLKRNLLKLLRSQSLVQLRFNTDEDYHKIARSGFYVLGPLAKECVPDLIGILNDTNSGQLSIEAELCLGCIGPEAKVAVPSLLSHINDPDYWSRFGVLLALERIHSQPEIVVPILSSRLSSTNELLHNTIEALVAYGEKAKFAAPSISTFLTNDDEFIRLEATNALKAIDPEAAAKAGIR